VRYVSPESLRMPTGVIADLKAAGIEQSEHTDINDVIAETDVLYVTRLQKERFTNAAEAAAIDKCVPIPIPVRRNSTARSPSRPPKVISLQCSAHQTGAHCNADRIAFALDHLRYTVDAALLAKAKAHMIVMHPLPRVDEISTEVDLDPRAAYFRQMQNGVYVRMALLSLVLNMST
jgi:aspartate carbamoyltransferase catalytic subunit